MSPLDFALELGLPCFPVLPDKRPSCPHGFKDAQRDPVAIRRLWMRYPGRLVGVPTGDVSGIDALDIDAPRHPEAGTWLATQQIPDTRIHRTVSGGFHFLFCHAPGLKSSAGGKRCPGVDIRADGGYIVWWPSGGFPYLDRPIVPWPPALLKAVQPPKPKRLEVNSHTGEQDIDRLVRFVSRAGIGERNNRLFWAACRLAEANGSIGKAAIVAAAISLGLPQIEAERTVESAFRKRIG